MKSHNSFCPVCFSCYIKELPGMVCQCDTSNINK